ncbi:hypothetical protein WR25_19060 [Diploscapter pachys]|uniref:Uncharacterized protein n=1 Tax=Diploscapter pachys TaxID=2018661 RepID=A0A2A2JYI4_9BILA|nr:hypothetical protein WR25_19060 [Diploscapter pachys]
MWRAWRACRAVPSTIGGHARPRRRWDELSYARRTLPYISEKASKRTPPACQPAPSHFADQQFVDAAAVETGDGRVIAILGQVDAQPFGERVGRHRTGNQQRSVVAHHHGGGLVGIGIARELAGDRGEQVRRGHDPFKMAVFVVD